MSSRWGQVLVVALVASTVGMASPPSPAGASGAGPVDIDIRPGSSGAAPVNAKAQGALPVADPLH